MIAGVLDPSFFSEAGWLALCKGARWCEILCLTGDFKVPVASSPSLKNLLPLGGVLLVRGLFFSVRIRRLFLC